MGGHHRSPLHLEPLLSSSLRPSSTSFISSPAPLGTRETPHNGARNENQVSSYLSSHLQDAADRFQTDGQRGHSLHLGNAQRRHSRQCGPLHPAGTHVA